ncbi:MAG: TolC family protein [Planctomycetes bacterium]|nr:TolC family protein [Planctomycetota bacterium]
MMKPWFASVLVLTSAFLGMAGCARQCFVSEQTLSTFNQTALTDLEYANPRENAPPLQGPIASPPTVDYPDRPPRFLSLQEAIALALENGTASGRGGAGTGLVDDSFVSLTIGAGSLTTQTDYIRVLSFNPAITQASLEQSASRFDAQWTTTMSWNTTDELQQGLSSFNNGQQAQFATSIVKALATGGVASISFNNTYTLLQQPPTGLFGVLNPSYKSSLGIGIEQPLLQNYGVEINQLLNRIAPIAGVTMPAAAAAGFNNKYGSLAQLPSFSGNQVEGILIARLRLDGQRAEFERNVNNLLVNTEVAYWKLYQAYGSLYSNEEVLRIAHKAWMIYKTQFDGGKKGPDEYQPVRGQYEQFRGQRIQSLGEVLERERSLRGIIGLPVEDGTRLVPVTPPNMSYYMPNWEAAVQDALNLKPELVLARQNLRLAQYNLIVAKNFLRPDLRAFAQYQPVGFGTSLDGTSTFVDGAGTTRTSNAFRSLVSDHFNDWSVGLTLNVPLGYRVEHAAVRQGRLALAQSYLLLKDQEDRARRVLYQNYEKVGEWYRLIETRRATRIAQAEGLAARFRKFAAGQITADGLLEQQTRLSNAQLQEYEAIAEYNNSLARFEWAKGTIRENNNVMISEGALPACAQERAVEHERERTKAIVLRERPLPYAHPGRLCGDLNGDPHTVRIEDERPDPVASKVMPTAPVTAPANNAAPGSSGVLPPAFFPGNNSVPASSLRLPPVTEPALPPTVAPPANLPPANLPPASLPSTLPTPPTLPNS